MRLHLDLACVKLNDAEVELSNTKAKLNNTEVKLNDMEEKTRELMKKFDTHQRQLHDTQEKAKTQVTKFDTRQEQFSLELTNTNLKLDNIEDKFDNIEDKFDNIEGKLDNIDDKLEDIEDKSNDTERKLETTRKEVEKFDKRIIWKIDNFRHLLQQAKAGKKNFICSVPFYSSTEESCGYKLKVKLFPNGSGSGKKTHLSVFIIVMKGEYDAILPWPFKKQVKITLIDQLEDLIKRENVIMSFIPGNYPQCFARPTQEQNSSGYGFPQFISHKNLQSRRYLVDDTLFLQVEIGP